MTLPQFYEKLKATRNGWRVTNRGGIRREGDRCRADCPITAVYHARFPKGLYISPFGFRKAGEQLGLDLTDTMRIVRAADSVFGAGTIQEDQRCRIALLEAVGVEEAMRDQ